MWKWIFALAFCAHVNAVEKFASYPVQKISLRGVTSIKISGVKGQLRLTGRKQTNFVNLKVRHSANKKDADWSLSVDRQGSTLVLEVFNVAYGAQWRKLVRQELWPEFDIDLDGKSLPTTVAWREGTIKTTNWSADLDISLIKGDVQIQGGEGLLALQTTQGKIDVANRKGETRLKGEQGVVTLKHLQGSLDVNWLNGQISVQSPPQKVKIESRSSDITASDIRGEFNLKQEGGTARLSAQAPANLNVIGSTGSVDLEWKSGGVKVFLTTAQGSIVTGSSKFIQLSHRGNYWVAEGLNKSQPKGEVFVRTDSGAIRWRP